MLRLPRSRRIRIWQDQHEYAMSFHDWELAVRSGAVLEDAMVWSRTITDSKWRRLGDMKLYAIWKTFPPHVLFDLASFQVWAGATKEPSAERVAVDRHVQFDSVLPPLLGVLHPLSTILMMVSRVILDNKLRRFRFVCSRCNHFVSRWQPECSSCHVPLRPGFLLEDILFGTMFFTDEAEGNV